MYKVFIEQKQVWIVETPFISEQRAELISGKEYGFKKLITKILSLPNGKNVDCLIIIVDNIEEFWKKFKKQFKFEKAAGGVIENKNGEILFIYRNRKWDLPKGKAEPEESAKETALREVAEECGVKNHSITKKLISTYHIYERKGLVRLKKTSWFSMKIRGEQNLVPQKEEGITKVEWLDKKQMKKVTRNTYSSIKRLLQSTDLI